jgi:DNA-binding Lrp family transcriptional regulator
MQETQASKALIPIRTQEEFHEAVEKTGQYRMLGMPFKEIGKALGVSEAQASRNFKKWIELHEKEWRSNKKSLLVRLNETFVRRMSEAEKRYLIAVERQEETIAGNWSKHIIEIAEKYSKFLQDCGYLNGHEFDLGKEEIKIETEPIMILISRMKKAHLERLNNAEQRSIGNS